MTGTVQRDPRYFWPNPEGFDPGRWLVDPKQKSADEFRLNTMAYMPFSYGSSWIPRLSRPRMRGLTYFAAGPTNCVGKNLALMEMRMAIAALVRKFEMQLAPGWDQDQWEKNCKDHFVLVTGPLPVIVTRRA